MAILTKDKHRFSQSLAWSLWRRVKKKSEEEGSSVQALIEEAVERRFPSPRKKQAA